MPQYRKKPVEIEAVLWDGDLTTIEGIQSRSTCARVWQYLGDNGVIIETLEGNMRANVGDWIIRGVKGELYPCKPDIFAATYDPA